MKGKLTLVAVLALTAASVIYAACRADDIVDSSKVVSSAPQTATKNATAKPAPSVVAQATPEEARRVTVEEAKKMLDEGKAVIYDTRAKGAYDAEHIKGALSMPFDQVATRVGELPKDKTVVFYCT